MYAEETNNEAHHDVFALLHSDLTVHGAKLFISLHAYMNSATAQRKL